jgi:ATP-dependent NAD(P)H-hydrate dehydratase
MTRTAHTDRADWSSTNYSARAVRHCIPELSDAAHKGSFGRVAVLGGSPDYTGAPYYAAMAALQTGADLAYIWTAREASLPLKCYSPELMVTSVYEAADASTIDNMTTNVLDLIQKRRIHALIIGPGLGRDERVLAAVAAIVRHVVGMNTSYLVLDADALFLLAEDKSIVKNSPKVVLTPNANEYKRLFPEGTVTEELSNCIVVRKGQYDEIYHAHSLLVCSEEGGQKRSGGIGDILAGTIGTLVAWQSILKNTPEHMPLAAWTACSFVKRATKLAFEKKHRAMTAPDVLAELGGAVQFLSNECIRESNEEE